MKTSRSFNLFSIKHRYSLFAGEYAEEEDQEDSFPSWAWILIVPFALVLFIWWWMGRRPKQVEFESPPVEQEPMSFAPQRTVERSKIPSQASSTGKVQEKIEETPKPTIQTRTVQSKPDNLQRIDGIGPKISQLFRDAGILTFDDLADSPVERLQQILDNSGIRIADPDTWPEQARFAAAGDWQGLQEFQSKLKGGRRVD